MAKRITKKINSQFNPTLFSGYPIYAYGGPMEMSFQNALLMNQNIANPYKKFGGKIPYNTGGWMSPTELQQQGIRATANGNIPMQSMQSINTPDFSTNLETSQLDPMSITGSNQTTDSNMGVPYEFIGNSIGNVADSITAKNNRRSAYDKTSVVGGVAKGAATGAAAGSAFGPIGTVAGGLIGGASSAFSTITQNKEAEFQFRQAKEESLKEQMISNLPAQHDYQPTFAMGGELYPNGGKIDAVSLNKSPMRVKAEKYPELLMPIDDSNNKKWLDSWYTSKGAKLRALNVVRNMNIDDKNKYQLDNLILKDKDRQYNIDNKNANKLVYDALGKINNSQGFEISNKNFGEDRGWVKAHKEIGVPLAFSKGFTHDNYRDAYFVTPLSRDKQETSLHELGHVTQLDEINDKLFKPKITDTNKTDLDYLKTHNEVYPRIMQIRKFGNLNPNIEIKKEHIPIINESPAFKELNEVFSEDQIREMLNLMVSNSNNSEDYKVAKYGGQLKYGGKINPSEIVKGNKEEMEHTSSRKVSRKTAMDHLKEDPKYYSKLKKAGLADSYPNGGMLSPKKFTQDYIQSPKYKERLLSSGYDNPEEEVNSRLSNVNNTKVFGQYGNPDLVKQAEFELTNRPYTKGGSSYLPAQNAIVVDHKQAKRLGVPPQSIEAHEFGHSEVNSGLGNPGEIRNSRLNDYDNSQIINRLLPNANSKYKTAPDEIKSDLNSLRYELLNKGIYNTETEDFNQNYLNQIKDSYIKDRLGKNYSDEDLIWLMNNIAKKDNNSNKKVAANGGILNSYANGGNITKRLSEFKSGGLHSENPNGGIKVGLNSLTEEGEFMYTTKEGEKYIFSNRF